MLELGAVILVSATALTFVVDAASSTINLMRSAKRRGNIRVADPEHSAH